MLANFRYLLNPIIKLISEGKMDKAIALTFKHFFNTQDKESINQLVAISSKWHRIKQEKNEDIISDELYRTECAKITKNLIELVSNTELDSIDINSTDFTNGRKSKAKEYNDNIPRYTSYLIIAIACLFLLASIIVNSNKLLVQDQYIENVSYSNFELLYTIIAREKEEINERILAIDSIIGNDKNTSTQILRSGKNKVQVLKETHAEIITIVNELEEVTQLLSNTHELNTNSYLRKRYEIRHADFKISKDRIIKIILEIEQVIYGSGN